MGVIVASEVGIPQPQIKSVSINGVSIPVTKVVFYPDLEELEDLTVSPDQKPIRLARPNPSSPTSSASADGPGDGTRAD
jgi:hypothetical protein